MKKDGSPYVFFILFYFILFFFCAYTLTLPSKIIF
jgi:hypothetical protein